MPSIDWITPYSGITTPTTARVAEMSKKLRQQWWILIYLPVKSNNKIPAAAVGPNAIQERNRQLLAPDDRQGICRFSI